MQPKKYITCSLEASQERVKMPKSKKKERTEYQPVKIPVDLLADVDEVVGLHGYVSRMEFVKDAVRRLLDSYGVYQQKKNATA